MFKPYLLFILLAGSFVLFGCKKVEVPEPQPNPPLTPLVIGKRVKEYRVMRVNNLEKVTYYFYDSLGRMVSRYEYTRQASATNANEKDTIIYQGSSILIQRTVYWDPRRSGGTGTDQIRYDRGQNGYPEKRYRLGAVIQDTTPFYPFGSKFYTWDTLRYFYAGNQFSQGLGHRFDSVFNYSIGMPSHYSTEERFDTLTQIQDASGFLIKTVRRSIPYEANIPPNVFQSHQIEEMYYSPLPDSAKIELSNSILAKEFNIYPFIGFYPYPTVTRVSRLDKWQLYQFNRNSSPPAVPQLITSYMLNFSFGADSLLQSVIEGRPPGFGAPFTHLYFYQ